MNTCYGVDLLARQGFPFSLRDGLLVRPLVTLTYESLEHLTMVFMNNSG